MPRHWSSCPTRRLLAAWFGGTREGASDVKIWTARRDKDGWSTPNEVAAGVDAHGKPVAAWNPVLFCPAKGPLMLFYKVGPTPAAWWGMLMTSNDSGKDMVRAESGCRMAFSVRSRTSRSSWPTARSCVRRAMSRTGGKLHIERATDQGATWTKTPPLNEGHKVRQIQPTLLDHGNGSIQLLSRSDAGKIFQSWSNDTGKTWEETTPTDLANPNSGIDAVQLKDGRSLLVFNPVGEQPPSVGGGHIHRWPALGRTGHHRRHRRAGAVLPGGDPDSRMGRYTSPTPGGGRRSATWRSMRMIRG